MVGFFTAKIYMTLDCLCGRQSECWSTACGEILMSEPLGMVFGSM